MQEPDEQSAVSVAFVSFPSWWDGGEEVGRWRCFLSRVPPGDFFVYVSLTPSDFGSKVI